MKKQKLSENELILKKQKNKKIRETVLIWFIFLSFVGSIIFVTYKLIVTPSGAVNETGRGKSDYVLMILQCLLGIFSLLMSGFLSKKIRIIIPSNMMIAFAIFLYCAIYLGEVRSFYYRVPHWDSCLHAFSAMMLGTLGFSIISLLNKSDRVPVNLSPAFVGLFTLCFAVTVGVVWEIYEFSGDLIFHTNMQKYISASGAAKVGQEALADTMKDLIIDFCGAFLVAVVGYISQKTRKNYLENFQLKKEKEQ